MYMAREVCIDVSQYGGYDDHDIHGRGECGNTQGSWKVNGGRAELCVAAPGPGTDGGPEAAEGVGG